MARADGAAPKVERACPSTYTVQRRRHRAGYWRPGRGRTNASSAECAVGTGRFDGERVDAGLLLSRRHRGVEKSCGDAARSGPRHLAVGGVVGWVRWRTSLGKFVAPWRPATPQALRGSIRSATLYRWARHRATRRDPTAAREGWGPQTLHGILIGTSGSTPNHRAVGPALSTHLV
eukprot:COSAG03_NODE_6878_length_992_cov_1.693169_1_plen_175_part_10